jgi:hypothetical protein
MVTKTPQNKIWESTNPEPPGYQFLSQLVHTWSQIEDNNISEIFVDTSYLRLLPSGIFHFANPRFFRYAAPGLSNNLTFHM